MILKRFYDERLAQASYLIGCTARGVAIVFDPSRDVEQYLDAARAERVRITHVTETHIHADFVSGTRELAARTGATMLISAEGGPDWQYGFADEPNVQLARDGDVIEVGNIVVRVSHTPGHTPEHISFYITDGAAADRPIGVVTGDFVFVGDVGRPDLLEKAAHQQGTMEASARTLFRSLQKFKREPDYLQIWPGHGAGSACGKGLSAIPHSTLGYERLFNWAFEPTDEDSFVQAVLSGQPDPPRYFAEMKRINRDGPRVLGGFARPDSLELDGLVRILDAGALVVDTRPAAEFAERHIPGTINIPLDRSFTTWAGWLIPYDREFHLIVQQNSPHAVDEAVKALAMIGLDRIAGYADASVIDAWQASGRPIEQIPQIQSADLAARMAAGEVAVVDVRARSEWEAGRLPGVPNIPLGYLTASDSELPRDRPLVVQCQAGARSSIGASLLQARGFNVVNLSGGFVDWLRSGQSIEKGA